MPDFESSVSVGAPPQAVFDFVSRVENLPKYLPTVKHAEPAGEGRVRVRSEVQGESREQDGPFRAVSADQRLQWGSDGERDYHGWMDIQSEGGDQSRVTVHLHLNPPPQEAAEIEQRSGGADFAQKMQEGVERCLQSIKNEIEGTGGKSEIPESGGSA